jgi:membrane protein DedA with SNARE-associated domain
MSMLPDFVTQSPLPSAFVFLLVFGFTLPICEEIALALVGAAMCATGTPFLLALPTALAALLLQDTAYFLAARLFGKRLIRHRLLSRLIKAKAVEEGERYFSRRGSFVVFSSRFVVGLRSAVILGAGLLGMRWPRFALYDSLAAAITTPAWLYVGFALGAQFGGELGRLSKLLGILGPVAVVAGAFLIFRSVRADKAKVDAEAEQAALDSAA